MTPYQYKAALARLGLTRLTAAEWLDVDEKTIRRWGKHGPPKRVAMLLERSLELERRISEAHANLDALRARRLDQ